jgi:8-oxo-dGTP pyrophosphatase MutT (NUDIX family)
VKTFTSCFGGNHRNRKLVKSADPNCVVLLVRGADALAGLRVLVSERARPAAGKEAYGQRGLPGGRLSHAAELGPKTRRKTGPV